MQIWHTKILTNDGSMPTYVVHPDSSRALPLVIVYMDALGIRAELETMANRMASAGHYVMLPNLFYRDDGPSFDPSRLPDYIDPEMERLNVETTMAMVAADTHALMEHARQDPLADAERTAVIGYCMGGRHAITAAATFPRQVRAAASIHGGRLVTAAEDSAHRRIREVAAELYFGFADNDPAAPVEHLSVIQHELERHAVQGTAELHEGALHGFAFPTRFCYHEAVSERCWRHWFAMLERNLSAQIADGSHRKRTGA